MHLKIQLRTTTIQHLDSGILFKHLPTGNRLISGKNQHLVNLPQSHRFESCKRHLEGGIVGVPQNRLAGASRIAIKDLIETHFRGDGRKAVG